MTLAVDDTDSKHLFIVADVDLGGEEELNTRFRFAFGHAFLCQLSAQTNEFVEFLDDEQYSSLTKPCTLLMGEMAHEFQRKMSIPIDFTQ